MKRHFNEALAQELLGALLAQGGDFAEVYWEHTSSQSLFLEGEKLERLSGGEDLGLGLRLVVSDRTFYAHTSDLEPESLLELATRLARGAEGKPGQVEELLLREAPVRFGVRQPPSQVETGEKAQLLHILNQEARRAPQVRQVTASYGNVEQEILVANSLGFMAQDKRTRVRLVVNVIAEDQGKIQTGYESIGGVGGFELVATGAPQMAQSARERAVMMLSARSAPSGQMTVVMAGEAGGTMVHEACGHGLEADLVQKRLSVYADKMGQRVASSLITVIDDATLPGRYGSFAFDDEGTPGQRTVLIENGILKSYMYNLNTARKENRESTGNGRRDSYRSRPIPRMSNTYIASGETDPEEIIAATENGLYVTKMGGGQVNTTNGDFVFEVTEGYLLQNGKIGAPVRGATLIGNGPQVLSEVDLVGQDNGFSLGVCGKNGQGVPVGDAQPTLRIPNLVVGGTEGV